MTMSAVDPASSARLVWRKSSHSNDQGGNCIEVADGMGEAIPVRDSKDPSGPVLAFTREAWQAFITDVRAGRFQASC